MGIVILESLEFSCYVRSESEVGSDEGNNIRLTISILYTEERRMTVFYQSVAEFALSCNLDGSCTFLVGLLLPDETFPSLLDRLVV